MSTALKRLLAALVFAGIPLLYFSFLPVSYNFDGTVFSQMLRYALLKHDWLEVVQLHHLAYFPLNYLAYRVLAALFHYRVLEFFHLQMFSLFFGAATLLLVERTLKKLGQALVLRVIGVSLVAFSYAFWQFAVDAEVHVPGVFFTLAGMYLLVFLRPEPAPLAAAAFCFAAAAGFHLTNMLVAISVFLYLLCRRAPWRRYAEFYLSYAGFMLLMYGAYSAMARQPVLSVLRNILFGADRYSGYHIAFAQPLSWTTLRLSLRSLRSALVAGAGVPAGLALAAALLLLLPGLRREADEERRLFRRAMFFWALPFFVFFSFWDPGNLEFKIHVVVPLLLLSAASLARLAPAATTALGATLAAALLWINLSTGILPQTEIAGNTNYQVAQSIRRFTPANSLVLITGSFAGYGYGKIYIPYFAGREVLILDWLLGKGHTLPEIRAALARRAGSGQPVYTLDEIALPGKALPGVLDFHKVPAKDLALFAGAIRFVPVAALPGADHLYRLDFKTP
jgi:hypothetical protein